MAKVKTIQFDLAGKTMSIKVNVTTGGLFTMTIPDEIADALHIQPRLISETLNEVHKKFNAALQRYKNASVKQELFLLISYKANGFYSKYGTGGVMFTQHFKGQYCMDSWYSRDINGICFDFTIAIKETIDTIEHWYVADRGKNIFSMRDDENMEPEKFYKERKFSGNIGDYKQIPFSETALESLINAREQLRRLSEHLFTFMEKDVTQIEAILTSGKMLGFNP